MRDTEMNSLCKHCDKWKAKQEEVLMNCESIFDVAIDMQYFEDKCLKTCPYIKDQKISENS